jgi:hypothetical protein
MVFGVSSTKKPVEGAVLLLEISAITPAYVHLKSGRRIPHTEDHTELIKRWVEMLMREVEIKPGWNPKE